MENKSINNLIQELAQKLGTVTHDPTLARQEAWWLLEKVTGLTKTVILTKENFELTQTQQQKLDELLHQRITQKKPLQYLLETVPFCGLAINVKPPILIPRPETEEWVTWLIAKLKTIPPQPLKILDLCTGTGCIGLALAAHFPHAHVWAIDINPTALELAKINQQNNNINNITFYTGDLFSALPAGFACDIMVSNPPYLSNQEYENLPEDVKNWEDKAALVASNAGLEFYTRILEKAPALLANSNLTQYKLPTLVFEIGPAQKHIEKIIAQYHIKAYHLFQDLQGHRRWVAIQI